MGECEGKSDDEDGEHGSSLIEEGDEWSYDNHGSKEAGHDNHRLEEGAATILSRNLGVEVDGELVVYGKLHQHPEGESTGEEEAGEGAQQCELILDDGDSHDGKREQ